jgi:hypothetical protein
MAIRWNIGDPLGSNARLADVLDAIQEQALGEGLAYEPAVRIARNRYLARLDRAERELATADSGT